MAMPRNIRFTVRLTETEAKKMRDWANRKHMIPSVAVRSLMARGLGPETPARAESPDQQIRQ
jgi:hypothetical protein